VTDRKPSKRFNVTVRKWDGKGNSPAVETLAEFAVSSIDEAIERVEEYLPFPLLNEERRKLAYRRELFTRYLQHAYEIVIVLEE